MLYVNGSFSFFTQFFWQNKQKTMFIAVFVYLFGFLCPFYPSITFSIGVNINKNRQAEVFLFTFAL